MARLPWGHIVVLLNKLDDRTTRDWYADRAGQWTRAVLEHHIHTRLHEREGSALSNFDETLSAGDGDDAAQPLLLRDPLVVDFVASADALRLDLLFYHHPTARWVVIDLKLTDFKPEYAGKMSLYVTAVDELVAREGDTTSGLEDELASLARVERQVTRFAARRAAELAEREGPN